jgi:hypothetical protein
MDYNHEHIALAVRAEHRHFHQRLHEIERLLSDAEPSGESIGRLSNELGALRGQLAQHFEREETGGFLDEAVALAPRLSSDAARLMRDHPTFLAELDGIIQLARQPAAGEAYEELREKLLDLFRALRLHEAGEDRILQQVFPSELGPL